MYVIGICGASGSGKSTLARELSVRLGRSCVTLAQDHYYKDHSGLAFSERERVNYDEPDAFEHDLLLDDLLKLESGEPISEKGYDFTKHARSDPRTVIDPKPVVILEGIHLFYDERLLKRMDLKIFIQVDPDICLLRRVRRDMRDRGRDLESISRQYLETVKPMYEKYIRDYARLADLILPTGGKHPELTDMICCYLKDRVIR